MANLTWLTDRPLGIGEEVDCGLADGAVRRVRFDGQWPTGYRQFTVVDKASPAFRASFLVPYGGRAVEYLGRLEVKFADAKVSADAGGADADGDEDCPGWPGMSLADVEREDRAGFCAGVCLVCVSGMVVIGLGAWAWQEWGGVVSGWF